MMLKQILLNTAVGFNRYMVECEYITTTVDNLSLFSFNRYMVECEYSHFFNVFSYLQLF